MIDTVISIPNTNVVTSAPPSSGFGRPTAVERGGVDSLNQPAGLGLGFAGMMPQNMPQNHYAGKSNNVPMPNPGTTVIHTYSTPNRPPPPRPSPLTNFNAAMSAALPPSVSPSLPPTFNPPSDYFGQAPTQPPRIIEQQHRLEQQLFERASQAQFLSDPMGRVGRRRGPGFSGRSMADFFCQEALRADMASRPAQSALMLDPEDPRTAFTPDRVHEFHTLFPLDATCDEPQVGSLGCASRVFKAVSELDGGTYVLRKLDGVRITGDHNSARKQWAELAHPSLVRLRNIFITSDFDGGQSNALTFVHDFVFGAVTLEQRHMRPPADGAPLGAVGEELVWCYVAQLMSALRFVHGHGRALRCVHASKVLVTSQHRVYLGGGGILDVIGDRKPSVTDLQAEDLRSLGSLLLQARPPRPHTKPLPHTPLLSVCAAGQRPWLLCGRGRGRGVRGGGQTVCHSTEATHPGNLSASVDYAAAHYHPDLKDLVVYLISQPGGPTHVTIFAASARVAPRLLEQAPPHPPRRARRRGT